MGCPELFIPNRQLAEPVEPRVAGLNDPPSCFERRVLKLSSLFFAARAHMWFVSGREHYFARSFSRISSSPIGGGSAFPGCRTDEAVGQCHVIDRGFFEHCRPGSPPDASWGRSLQGDVRPYAAVYGKAVREKPLAPWCAKAFAQPCPQSNASRLHCRCDRQNGKP